MNEFAKMNHRIPTLSRPRLGFLGVGWIGRHRMQAILDRDCAEVVAVADASADALEQAAKAVPGAKLMADIDSLLAEDLDGIVIATPSAQHAEQAIRALNAGVAVFCQKPLGRTAEEVSQVLEAAKAADRMLGIDFSYRHTKGMQQIRELVRSKHLGNVFAADLVFHNAYGPDKPWFYDKMLSGGGCVMDLGVHLIDLALWTLDFPKVAEIASHLFRDGQQQSFPSEQVEDFAVATMVLENGVTVRLASSWRLQAGCDAIIEANFFGTSGGASMRNVNGSFFDFITERFHGTSRERLAEPPEDWGGRAASTWAEKLCQGGRYDRACETVLSVAEVIDRIYRR